MKIEPTINSEFNGVEIMVRFPLIGRYFNNLASMISGNKELSSHCTPIKINSGLVSIKTDQNVGKIDKMPANSINGNEAGMVKAAIDSGKMKELSRLLEKFAELSVRQELRTVEFIPLRGYSSKNLSDEIDNAILKGRRFCIIKDFTEFLNMERNNQYIFNQYMVYPKTDEYVNVAYLVKKKKLGELRDIYKDKLVLTNWVD